MLAGFKDCFLCYSERYMVTYSKLGMPKDIDLLERMFALFSVGPHDSQKMLVSICYI